MGCCSSKPQDSVPSTSKYTALPQEQNVSVTATSRSTTHSSLIEADLIVPQTGPSVGDLDAERVPFEPTPASEPINASASAVRVIREDEGEAYGLLLCGAGESGKTTFTRQLKIHYLGGFDETERRTFVATIRGNLIETMQNLLVYLERHQTSVDDGLVDTASEITDLQAFNCEFNEDIVDQLKELWEDPNIIEAFKHRDETTIPDHMDYFFNKIDQLVDDSYIPSDEDILRARIRTIGVDAVTFDIDGARIRIYDVGGQKSERSKWSTVESSVESVIFCISFSEFDKPMFEEPSTMRIIDAIKTFESIAKKPKFAESPIFLICNKIDQFEQKILETDRFTAVFPEYTGDAHDPNACADYIIQLFKDAAGGSTDERPIIPYKIVALDSAQVVNTTGLICRYINENIYE